jgi:hypothetical protein
MSCTDSRSELTEQELAITQSEGMLGFGANHVVQTDCILRRFSYQGQVNPTQLADSCKFLALTTPAAGALYELMKVDTEPYSLTNLLLVGVLLSYGAASENARISFEIYCCHRLDCDTVIRMVEDIYQVTVLQLPVLARHSAWDSLVLGYIEQIKYRAERGKEKLVSAFLTRESQSAPRRLHRVPDQHP